LLAPILLISLGGCSTLKIPDMDFIKFPEFREEAENIGDYPKVEDAPEAPSELRSDAEWDKAAKRIIAKRDGKGAAPAPIDTNSDAQIKRKINELAAKVEEYKLDDPQ